MDTLEHRIIHKDGSWRWIRNTLVPHYDEQGRVQSYDGVLSDITEKKMAEQRLLAETQRAMRSEKEAQDALAVKNEFTATVSHELRTPLAISKEALSLILRGKLGQLPEKQKEIIEMASSNIDRLAILINDILDASKMEAGKMELNKEVIDVVQLARESCE